MIKNIDLRLTVSIVLDPYEAIHIDAWSQVGEVILRTYQFMSFKEFCAAQGCLHKSTTTESAFAGMNPRTKAFRIPQA